MNVVIVEDEKLTALRLEKLLAQYDPTIRVLAVLPSVAKGVAWFAQTSVQPDLLFLDIHLRDDSGFRLIELAGLTQPIIFTTAYDQYTLQAFKTNGVGYLLKPIDEADLAVALDKFKRLHSPATSSPMPDITALVQALKSVPSPYKERFMVTVGAKIRSIETADIAYFFFEDKAAWLITRDGQHIDIEYSLDKLEMMLDPRQFFRINRAFLVTLTAIRSIHTYSGSKLKVDLQPASRKDVFVSGNRVTDFKAWLGK